LKDIAGKRNLFWVFVGLVGATSALDLLRQQMIVFPDFVDKIGAVPAGGSGLSDASAPWMHSDANGR
jgi:hypothetical protein